MNDRLPTLMECFSELVALPSVSSTDARLDMSNRKVVERLGEWLASAGFVVELMAMPGQPDKLNLIACAGKGEGGLVLSGHTDTVPCNESAWQQDPFRLTEQDNRLFGLGSADMKCFFPIILEALKDLDLDKLQQSLYILATCDEESTMAGARALVEAGRSLGRYALIGEPTGLKPVNMHKGILLETVCLQGRAGHSSDPALGLSALEGMNTVINKLLDWRGQLQSRVYDAAFKVPVPTLNLGSIHGGDNPNRICAACDLSIDLRILPGMDLEEMRAELKQTVMQAIDGTGLVVEFTPVYAGLPAMYTDPGAAIVKLAERLTGEAAGAVAFGTEGPYFNGLGMETLILGPGDIEQAHQANEYLAMDRIEPMIEILKKLIINICMKDTGHDH